MGLALLRWGEIRMNQNETVWLTPKARGELFGVETNTINYHLKAGV